MRKLLATATLAFTVAALAIPSATAATPQIMDQASDTIITAPEGVTLTQETPTVTTEPAPTPVEVPVASETEPIASAPVEPANPGTSPTPLADAPIAEPEPVIPEAPVAPAVVPIYNLCDESQPMDNQWQCVRYFGGVPMLSNRGIPLGAALDPALIK